MIRLAFAALFLLTLEAAYSQCLNLVWSDEFDGTTVNLDNWTFQIGDGCDINLCGWGNSELQWYTAQNATVSDGTLKIEARLENSNGYAYTSARMRSINKVEFTYGRFEARIKMPIGQGMWPAFWMLSTDQPYGGWPQSGEIDIVEMVGFEPNIAHGTIHYGPAWPNNLNSGGGYEIATGVLNDNFHEYAVEWEENEIRWYFDGHQYLVLTSGNIGQGNWPFDHDFHMLLNLAVGGNWPGRPDASTQFPQTLEVDYVRYYTGTAPYILGLNDLPNQAQGIVYSIRNASDNATYNWSVSGGGTIRQGQGTSQILVDWGEQGGVVTAELKDDCNDKAFNMDVFVAPGFSRSFAFENFDEPGLVDFSESSGTLEEIDNPAPDDVNGDSKVGRYVRNGSDQFDLIRYKIDDFNDAVDYAEEVKKFYLDIQTDAAVGTQIIIQLENSNTAQPDNYPIGRYARFHAFVGTPNAWERHEFNLLDEPHASTSSTSVDEILILFAPGSFSSNTWHYDNFDSYEQGVVSVEVIGQHDFRAPKLFPNPAAHYVVMQNDGPLQWDGYEVFDLQGKLVLQNRALNLLPGNNERIDLQKLHSGPYLVRFSAENSVHSTSFMKME